MITGQQEAVEGQPKYIDIELYCNAITPLLLIPFESFADNILITQTTHTFLFLYFMDLTQNKKMFIFKIPIEDSFIQLAHSFLSYFCASSSMYAPDMS